MENIFAYNIIHALSEGNTSTSRKNFRVLDIFRFEKCHKFCDIFANLDG